MQKNEKTKHQLCDIISDMKSLENFYFSDPHWIVFSQNGHSEHNWSFVQFVPNSTIFGKKLFLWNVIALKEFKISKIAKKPNKLTVKNSTHETIAYYTIIWTKNVELTQTDYALDS